MGSRALLVMMLLSASSALAVDDVDCETAAAGEPRCSDVDESKGPVGDPPPAPGPVDPVPPDDGAERMSPPPAGPTPGEPVVRPLPPPDPPRRATLRRRRGPSAGEVLGRSGGAGAAAAVSGAAAALVVGGATIAAVLTLENASSGAQARVFAGPTALLGAVLTPFSAALAASMATLFVTRPTASPEEYAQLAQTCAACAATAACAALCIGGAVVAGPSLVFAPSCGSSAGPSLFRAREGSNAVPFAAGIGAGLGTVAGAGAMWLALASYPTPDAVMAATALLGGAGLGAAAGGLLVGSVAVLVDEWPGVVFE